MQIEFSVFDETVSISKSYAGTYAVQDFLDRFVSAINRAILWTHGKPATDTLVEHYEFEGAIWIDLPYSNKTGIIIEDDTVTIARRVLGDMSYDVFLAAFVPMINKAVEEIKKAQEKQP